jgi:hypothetical protein
LNTINFIDSVNGSGGIFFETVAAFHNTNLAGPWNFGPKTDPQLIFNNLNGKPCRRVEIVLKPKVVIIKEYGGTCPKRNAPVVIGKQIEIVMVSLQDIEPGVKHDPEERRCQLTETPANPLSQPASIDFITRAKPPPFGGVSKSPVKGENLPWANHSSVKKRGGQRNVPSLAGLKSAVCPLPVLKNQTSVFKNEMGEEGTRCGISIQRKRRPSQRVQYQTLNTSSKNTETNRNPFQKESYGSKSNFDL